MAVEHKRNNKEITECTLNAFIACLGSSLSSLRITRLFKETGVNVV